jgi:hypothetical protein
MNRTIFVVFLLAGVGLAACERGGPAFVESVSPGGTYTVVVSGIPEAPTGMFVDHKARVTVSKSFETVVSNRVIHWADSMDRGFTDEFGPHEWTRENVFRFVSSGAKHAHFLDRVTIRNGSSRRVRFLRVLSTDMLLVFELDPGGGLTLQITGQPRIEWFTAKGQTTYSWIAAEGVWDDGKEIAFVGRNFYELPTNTAQEYDVTIASSGLSIERRKSFK